MANVFDIQHKSRSRTLCSYGLGPAIKRELHVGPLRNYYLNASFYSRSNYYYRIFSTVGHRILRKRERERERREGRKNRKLEEWRLLGCYAVWL
jgi:hypothetical protein